MATESNTGFHYDDTFGSVMGRHAISFQPGAISSNSGVIPVGSYLGSSTFLPANSGIINSPPGIIQTGNSSGSSLLLESVPGLNHDTGLAVEWSSEEQRKLEEGLDKFKDEPNIMKYIKIAATLRDKTVRDVALRCRWMQRKRRKHEEQNAGKKQGNRKDKLVESSSKTNMSSVLPQSMGMYPLPLTMHHQDQSERISSEGIIGGKAMHLLEQNVQAFNQITSNLSAYKLQDNINLFFHTRNNIAAILKDMRDTPGIMSQMPPLPVSINEDLASSIMLSTPQSMMFGMPGGIHHLKQEPRC